MLLEGVGCQKSPLTHDITHRGGTQAWFWEVYDAKNLKMDLLQIFKEKVTHSYANWLNFGPNFCQNRLQL